MASIRMSTDLVIVGGGGGGLPAALSALESGIKEVVVLDKRPTTGGAAMMAGGFIFATATRHQAEKGLMRTADEIFQSAMEFHHYDQVKPKILRAYIDKSGSTIHWLEDNYGVEFFLEDPVDEPGTYPTTHIIKSQTTATLGFSRVTKLLTEKIKELGGTVLTNTCAIRIQKDAEGRVSGVDAVSKDGDELEISAKAAILCTGNYAANRAMLHKYFPEKFQSDGEFDMRGGFCYTSEDAQTGDGVVMGVEAGVQMEKYSMLCAETGFCFSDVPIRHSATIPYRAAHAGPCVWVNARGERFHEKSTSNDNTAANATWGQPGHCGWALFDEAMLKYFEDYPDPIRRKGKELPTRAPLIEQFEKGTKSICIADTWNEIACYIGCKPEKLKETIEEYNGYCDKGHDDLFNKPSQYLMPLRTAPFYALKFDNGNEPNPYGALVANQYMEAQDVDYETIPGLYLCGVIVSGFQGRDYHLFGSGLGFSISSGRIAGEQAAEYIKTGYNCGKREELNEQIMESQAAAD